MRLIFLARSLTDETITAVNLAVNLVNMSADANCIGHNFPEASGQVWNVVAVHKVKTIKHMKTLYAVFLLKSSLQESRNQLHNCNLSNFDDADDLCHPKALEKHIIKYVNYKVPQFRFIKVCKIYSYCPNFS